MKTIFLCAAIGAWGAVIFQVAVDVTATLTAWWAIFCSVGYVLSLMFEEE